MSNIEALKNELVAGFHSHVVEESVLRIKRCMEELSHDQIWKKPCASGNSIGHLILHLLGNARQYLLVGIAGEKDVRARRLEFHTTEHVQRGVLIGRLDELVEEMNGVLEGLRAEELLYQRRIQCFDMSVMRILLHVMEHFTYHTGQIVYYTKLLTDRDLKFYDDDVLNSLG